VAGGSAILGPLGSAEVDLVTYHSMTQSEAQQYE